MTVGEWQKCHNNQFVTISDYSCTGFGDIRLILYSLSESCAGEGGRYGVGLDAVYVRGGLGGGAEDLGHGHVAPLGDVVAGGVHVLPHTDALRKSGNYSAKHISLREVG